MKKATLFSLIAGCAMALATPVILAETMLQDTDITKSQENTTKMSIILQSLQTGGYVAVKEVKLDNGVYRAEAINAQGEKIDVHLDPETGKVIKPQSTSIALSMLAAIQKVEEAGFHNIYKVESDGDEYEVKALDKDGKKSNLKVDAYTGKVTKKWFD